MRKFHHKQFRRLLSELGVSHGKFAHVLRHGRDQRGYVTRWCADTTPSEQNRQSAALGLFIVGAKRHQLQKIGYDTGDLAVLAGAVRQGKFDYLCRSVNGYTDLRGWGYFDLLDLLWSAGYSPGDLICSGFESSAVAAAARRRPRTAPAGLPASSVVGTGAELVMGACQPWRTRGGDVVGWSVRVHNVGSLRAENCEGRITIDDLVEDDVLEPSEIDPRHEEVGDGQRTTSQCLHRITLRDRPLANELVVWAGRNAGHSVTINPGADYYLDLCRCVRRDTGWYVVVASGGSWAECRVRLKLPPGRTYPIHVSVSQALGAPLSSVHVLHLLDNRPIFGQSQ